MIRALASVVVIIAACGRVGFTPRDEAADGGGDGATIDAPCEAMEWNGTITRLAGLSVGNGVEDWEPAVSPDEKTIVFSSYRAGNGDTQLFIATRASADDEFGPPQVIGGFGAVPGTDVYGPAWSLDGNVLYFSNETGSREVDYLGGTSFGTARPSGLPGFSPVFAGPDDVYTTTLFAVDDYDLEHWTRSGADWTEQPLPTAYNRNVTFANDGWPTFDRARRQMYFEHEASGDARIVRVQVDASGAVPAIFDELGLDVLGDDVGDPDLSADGLRLYVSSRRRDGTDNDIYMFERTCQ